MKFPIFSLFLLFVLSAVAVSAQTGDSDPVLQSSATYTMPQEAVDAGIDGSVTVGIHVDETGKPTRANLITGPMWPCGSTPVKALEKLSSTLADTMLKLHFSPAIKDGKPIAKDIGLTFTLKNPTLAPKPAEIDPATGKPIPRLISGGVVNGKAKSLPRPSYPEEARAARESGSVAIQILIDEQGKVLRAGAVSGASSLQFAARAAACEAQFSPTTLQGRPVKVSGVITYNFNL